MQNKIIIQIRVIGLLLAVFGLFKFYCILGTYFIENNQTLLTLIVTLIITLVVAISGVSIFLFKNWARRLLLGLLIIGVLLQAFGLIRMKDFSFNSILYTVIFIALTCVFTNTKIKNQFK